MGFRVRISLGVRLAIVLAVLSVVFVGVVYLTVLDARSMERELQRDIAAQEAVLRLQVANWRDAVTREVARQMATPFLWNVETLQGVDEGTAEFRRLQRRMWQFVYGQDTAPLLHAEPVGPLESVVVVDLDHRIVAASDEMVVDQEYKDPEDLRVLAAALNTPQLRRIEGERADGRTVYELSVAAPNSRGAPIGIVRLRYVGGPIAQPPGIPLIRVAARPHLWGPALAGLLALFGVGFGALATSEVISLTRQMEAMAHGEPMRPLRTGPGARALSLIEERLEALSDTVRREDLWVSSLAEALREGVILLDRQGKLVVANRQARQLCGFREAAPGPLGSSFVALRRANPPLEQLIDSGLKDRQAVRDRPMTLSLPDGRLAPVQLTTYVLHDEKTVAGTVLVIKDLPSIAALERSLQEASRLQAIVRLTGSVAHEVKNPLGAIGIHLEHLRRRLVTQRDPDRAAEDRVQIIREEIDRLREVLDEWLRLTSPDERVPAAMPARDVLASVARLLRVEARHQKVELIVEHEGELGVVRLPAANLRQVLLNLCLNGLQAMPEGGRLTIRGRPQDNVVVFEVEDTGAGIPENLRERIFDLHFTTRPDGSGLGLAICKRFIEQSGGAISFESRPGKGTTFRVTLPQAATARDRADASESA